MLGIVTLPFRIAFLPVTLLWIGYKGLWWSVQGSSVGGGGGSVGEAVGRMVGMGSPSRWALRGAFAGTLMASAITAVASFAAAREGVISPDHAAWIWAWGSLLITTIGLVIVRISQRPREHAVMRMRAAAQRLKRGSKRAMHLGAGAAQSVVKGVAEGWRGPTEPPIEPSAMHADKPAGEPVKRAGRSVKVGKSIGRAGSAVTKRMGMGLVAVGQRLAGSGTKADRVS